MSKQQVSDVNLGGTSFAYQPAESLRVVYYICMPKGMFEVPCPCCQAILKIDPETRAVIAHTVPEKPPAISDLAAEVAKLKGEGARREEVFRKQFEAEKTHGKVLEKKFDELFKRAKENPDQAPPKRDIDFD
jgi:hypothetical protein